jgi:SAM-dependent methyltransferase
MPSFSEIAARRLNPSLSDPSYLLLRSRRRIIEGWANALQGNQLNALDVGGRYQPYRPLFAERVHRYIAVDLLKTEVVTVVADASALPFAPGSFDLVIATQVMEYVRDPRQAAEQIHLALRPGGILLASFASFSPRFGEDERWRFMPSGIKTLLEAFAFVEILPELNSLGSLIRSVNVALDGFVKYPAARNIYRHSLCPLLNLAGLAVGRLGVTSNTQFAANFSVRAVKKT